MRGKMALAWGFLIVATAVATGIVLDSPDARLARGELRTTSVPPLTSPAKPGARKEDCGCTVDKASR